MRWISPVFCLFVFFLCRKIEKLRNTRFSLSLPWYLHSLCFESSASILCSFQGAVQSLRFHLINTMEYLINLKWRRRCNANGDLLALNTKYTLMDIKNGKSIPYATQAVKNEDLES